MYKEQIISFFKSNIFKGIVFVLISIAIYFLLPLDSLYLMTFKTILISISFLCLAISYDVKLLNNSMTKTIGEISFHIYLCHMVIFRIIEKVGLLNVFKNAWLSYIALFVMVFIGAITLAVLFNKLLLFLEKRMYKNENTTC